VAKYTGGGDPTKGCFAKGEAKDPNDWQFTNDAATVQGLAEEGAWGSARESVGFSPRLTVGSA
jgi:hypothetical protein